MMTADEYREHEGANWSTIKYIVESPLHYKHALKDARKVNAAMLAGLASHTAVLEPQNFLRDYVLCDLPDRRGKKWDEFQAAHTDRTILLERDYQRALDVRESVMKHKVARTLLSEGEREIPIFWPDPATGVLCKSRLDHLGRKVLVDLKTIAAGDRRTIRQQVGRFLYHGQLAMYRDAVRCTTGIDPEVYLIFVESQPPHDVGVFRFGSDELDLGGALYHRLLSTLKFCRERDEWPGRYPEEQILELPSWLYDENESAEMSVTVEAF